MSPEWVDAAQVASGLAAVMALIFAATTVRASRRAPLAESYLRAWETILDIVVEASHGGPKAPDTDQAEKLLREYRSADQRLAVLEAALGVKAYGRDIRHDVHNILMDVLFEDTEARRDLTPLPNDVLEPPDWADPETWPRVSTSVAISSLLCNHIFDHPGDVNGGGDDMLNWYAPRVLRALDNPDSVYSPLAEPQYQIARLLSDYHNDFLLPWVRDATREALLGRRGIKGHKLALRRWRWKLKNAARRLRPWRRKNPSAIPHSYSSIFHG